MHGDVAAVSVAVHQRVFRPASLIRANAATTNHLLHIILRQLVVRRQTTLAGDHLWGKRTCGGIRYKDKAETVPKDALLPRRSAALGPSRSKCHVYGIYVPFRHGNFSPKHPLHGATVRRRGGTLRREPDVRNDARRACACPPTGSKRRMWLDCWMQLPFWFHMAKLVWKFLSKRLSPHCQHCNNMKVGKEEVNWRGTVQSRRFRKHIWMLTV